MAEEPNGPHILYALQVVFPLAQVGDLVPEVGNLLLESGDGMTRPAKAAFLDALTSAIMAQLDHIHYVCWDMITDPDDAVAEYWQWIEGTAADARSETPWKHGDEQQFGFVTILLLVLQGSEAAEMIEAFDDVEDDERCSADHLAQMLSTLPVLDLQGLTSDVVMVRPGDGGYGIMESLLADETYHHLQPVV